MVRNLATGAWLLAMTGCGGEGDELRSTPLDEPSVDFLIEPIDVDTDWPVVETDTDTDTDADSDTGANTN